jgi:hypothetical protein
MNAADWTAVGSIATAVAVLIAIGTILVTLRTSKRSAEDSRIAQGLGLMTGGTQPRSVGISLLFTGVPERWREGVTSVLASQVLYLLTRSDEKDRPHEIKNLDSLITLFLTTTWSLMATRRLVKASWNQLMLDYLRLVLVRGAHPHHDSGYT